MENNKKELYNLAAEKALLGHILINDDVHEDIFSKINGSDFANKEFEALFDTMKKIHLSGNSVNLISISEHGYQYSDLEKLMNCIPSNFIFEHSINLIQKLSKKRKIIKLGEEMKQLVFADKDPDEVKNYVQKQINMIDIGDDIEYTELSKSVMSILDEIKAIQNQREKGIINGLSTGIVSLDQKLGGMRGDQLIIIAARPSMGKSTLALNTATNHALNGETVGFVSLEMSARSLRNKIISRQTFIEYNRIRDGLVDEKDVKKIIAATDKLIRTKMFFIEQGKVGISQIVKFAKKMKKENDLKALYIDYLGLMVRDVNNRMNEISEITRELKLLAGELDIPIILLSQLNRNLESREDKRPILSDLRDSGSIEQDADVIMFLYRDAYYNPKKTEDIYDDTEIIIAKQREGATPTIHLGFNKSMSYFFDYVKKEEKNDGNDNTTKE